MFSGGFFLVLWINQRRKINNWVYSKGGGAKSVCYECRPIATLSGFIYLKGYVNPRELQHQLQKYSLFYTIE